jgi:3-hydroxyacyl-CoA dehydrogenase
MKIIVIGAGTMGTELPILLPKVVFTVKLIDLSEKSQG